MAESKSHANEHHRSDEESVTSQSKQLKRKKRIKLAICISTFAVIQIIVITVLALTVFRVKSPKVSFGTVNVQTLNATAAPATPSFEMTFTTQIRIKNTNFGPYKFDASTVKFMLQDRTVGEVRIPKSKAGMRSTKKIGVTVSLSSKGLPSRVNVGGEMSTGVLRLYSEARLAGKVELMFVMKKKKTVRMLCSLGLLQLANWIVCWRKTRKKRKFKLQRTWKPTICCSYGACGIEVHGGGKGETALSASFEGSGTSLLSWLFDRRPVAGFSWVLRLNVLLGLRVAGRLQGDVLLGLRVAANILNCR